MIDTQAATRKIRSAFETFDQANNDTCDVREIGTVLRSIGLAPTEEQLRGWIRNMEEEEPTGYVRYDRFLPVALSVYQSEECGPSDEERIFRAFQTLDIERKGYLTPDELRRFLMTDGEPFTQEELEEMLNAATDPTDNKVYYEDFISIVHQ